MPSKLFSLQLIWLFELRVRIYDNYKLYMWPCVLGGMHRLQLKRSLLMHSLCGWISVKFDYSKMWLNVLIQVFSVSIRF